MSDGCKTLKKQCAGEAENPLEDFERGKWCYYKGDDLETCRCCWGDCPGFERNCDDLPEPSITSSKAEIEASSAWEKK